MMMGDMAGKMPVFVQNWVASKQCTMIKKVAAAYEKRYGKSK